MRLKAVLVVAAIMSLPGLAQAAPLPRPGAFAMCGVCHKVAAGERPTLGPNLWDVGGRQAGTIPGFAYSPALAKSGIAWNRENLIAFIIAPQAKVPGTKMAFAGQKNPKLAADLADYVLSLK